MPLPEPSEQNGENVKPGQEPSSESPETGTDVVPIAPMKPKEFSNLVLLTASTENGDGLGCPPKGMHCVMSLEISGPDTLARTLQILPAEEQGGTVQQRSQAPEQRRGKPDTGEFQACYPWPCMLMLWPLCIPLSSGVTLALPSVY